MNSVSISFQKIQNQLFKLIFVFNVRKMHNWQYNQFRVCNSSVYLLTTLCFGHSIIFTGKLSVLLCVYPDVKTPNSGTINKYFFSFLYS